MGRTSKARREWIAAGPVICGICGLEISNPETTMTVDHIIPRRYGGTDARANLQPAHSICNQMKGDEWAGHFARSANQGQGRPVRIADINLVGSPAKEGQSDRSQ